MAEFLRNAIGFGAFRLCRGDYSLLREREDGGWTEIPLRPKAFDLLRYMVENPGRLISPDELLDRLWPNIHVQADGLKGHVLTVRAALGDDPANPTFIETVRGRGYRFIAPVSLFEGEAEAEAEGSRSLVGRAGARRELETLLRRASAGEAEIGFVTGEPGIGKTALVNDFLKSVSRTGVSAAISRCLPGSADSDVYYPVLDILTQLARGGDFADFGAILARIAPTWLIQLPWLMPETMAGGTRQQVFGATPHRMIRELCDLLDELSRDRLLVLMLEDIHWADPATLDLINAIATRRLQSRLLVLSTLRPTGANASAKAARTLCQTLSLYRLGKEIALAALSEDDVGDYLCGIAGVPPPPALARHLHGRSEGNPLFMTAMLDHFVQEGAVALGQDGWLVAETLDEAVRRAPPSLARIIESEVEKLAPDVQAVLDAAAISEGTFSAAVNQAATDLEEPRFEALCEELAGSGGLIRRADHLVLPCGRRVQGYVFRHMLFRDVVYERQSATRRAAAHLAIGARLEAVSKSDLDAAAPVLAHHFMAAEQWGKAIGYFRSMARNALQRFSTREAAATLEQALTFIGNQPPAERAGTELDLLEDLARIYAGSLDARAGETYVKLSAAAARSGRLDVECRALMGHGFTLAWVDLDRSHAVLGQAIEKSARLEDPIARARTRTFAHGWRNWQAGWSEADARACTAALEEIRASGDIVALNAALVDYTLVIFPSSRYQESHDVIQSCFQVLVADGAGRRADTSLPLWILRLGRPWSLMYAGKLGAALDLFGSGVRSFLDNADTGRAATLQFYQGFCHVLMQDPAGALDLCAEARQFCRCDGSVRLSPNEQQIGLVVQGLAELGKGRLAEARALLNEAGEVMRHHRTLTSWHWRMAREWGMADSSLAAGEIDVARHHALLLHQQAHAIRERTWRALASETCARIALALGDREAACLSLREGWAETETGDLPLATWRLHAVEAELAERAGTLVEAEAHRRKRRAALERLADSLPPDHACRRTILAAQPNDNRNATERPRPVC